MIINHNLNAMNAHRNMAINNANSGKSMEKLSSGLRINRAGDDAAGLAISEKMRGQIRGLDTASRNAQDGISMVQTAEGALNETHSILQRMRELATQASNDTNTMADRKEIQKEMNQLTAEISRVGNNTEFNTQKLLNGNKAGVASVGGTVTELKSSVTVGTLQLTSKLTGTLGDAQSVEFVKGSGNDASLDVAYNTTSHVLTITLGTDSSGNLDAAKNTNTLIAAAITGDTDANAAFTVNAGTGADVQATVGTNDLTGGRDAGTTVAKDGKATLQIGANQGQGFTVEISDMRASALGIAGTAGDTAAGVDAADVVVGASFTVTGTENDLTDVTATGEHALDVSDNIKASAAVKVIDKAIASVSSERSKLGAYQNRLEHTIANLGTASENLTSAESRIRDVDMAKEMMEFSKNNILSQAAQAMIAQANQQPQGVLQLLR